MEADGEKELGWRGDEEGNRCGDQTWAGGRRWLAVRMEICGGVSETSRIDTVSLWGADAELRAFREEGKPEGLVASGQLWSGQAHATAPHPLLQPSAEISQLENILSAVGEREWLCSPSSTRIHPLHHFVTVGHSWLVSCLMAPSNSLGQ